MEELDLRVEDAAALADRVDGQARVVRGHLEGFPRDTRQLEGHVNPSRSHDDFRGGFTGLASLVGDRRWRAEGSLGRGADRGQARVSVNPTEKSIERTRQVDIPVSGRFLGHWGPPGAPALGGPQKSSPSPPPSPPSPPLGPPAPPAPPPDRAAMTSSMRSTMTAASVADETAWVPPRIRIEIAFGFLQPVTKVISSSPIFFS